TAGAGDLPELLLGQRVKRGLGGEAEIAGERDLEADAEAVAAVGGDHRLLASRRRGDVPGQLGNVLRARLQEALDVAAAGEMLAVCAQHDHAHFRMRVQRLEGATQLVALRHAHHVERRAGEDDVAAFARGVHFDAKAVGLVEQSGRGMSERHGFSFNEAVGSAPAEGSRSYSPAISLRRRIFPTGDFGIALTNTYSRGRLKFGRSVAWQYASSACASTATLRLTKATTRWPQRSSRSPATATSSTAGCSDSTDSISTGEMFSPPEMIMSSTRPVTNRSPSWST